MNRIRLIHWNANEAAERVEQLRAAGCQVDFAVLKGGGDLRDLATDPPDAVIIDLHRLPAAGRDMGLFLRKQGSTRRLPLVFAGGDPAKVARIRELLPDATYSSWSRIRESLDRAIHNPPADPVVPDSALAGYSRTPLPKKLGIKENMAVALIGAPEDFETTVGDVPDGVVFLRDRRNQTSAQCPLTIWFQPVAAGPGRRHAADVEGSTGKRPGLDRVAEKASGVETDLTQPMSRKTGLAVGLVDYKICAIDKTWSGLLFTRRKS